MARYAVGDIQGCFAEFSALLNKINFDPRHDRLFSVGDIVNRGPDSLSVLRWMYQHRDAVHMVLGNHDLHLLAVALGSSQEKPHDTLKPILLAKDKDILLDWLRRQPLFSVFEGFCIVHAGVWPGWRLDEVKELAQAAQHALQADNYRECLKILYGNQPNVWSSSLQGIDRFRFVINSMTRMRVLSIDKTLNFSFKGPPKDLPASFSPWYTFPQCPDIPRIICGHWSALNLCLTPHVWSLDTGCVWGNQLTMVNCDTGEIFQQVALKSAVD